MSNFTLILLASGKWGGGKIADIQQFRVCSARDF